MAVNTNNAAVFIKVDTRKFNRALKEYAATTKKDGDLIVNTAAMHCAMMATHYTRHADPAKIAALKEVSSVVVFGKSGRRLKDINAVSKSQRERRTNYQATTRAMMILLYWARKNGVDIKKKYTSRAEIMAAALAMVNARIKSVNYLRSGWLQAVAKFKTIVRGRSPVPLPKIKNPGPGGAIISTGGKATAELWNSSLYSKNQNGVSQGLYKYGAEGLRRALGESRKKLLQIARERQKKAAERFNSSR